MRDDIASAAGAGVRRAALPLLAALVACPALLPAATRVRTAYYLEPGMCERQEDGSYAGATLDYLAALAKLNDWEIEPVYCSYDEALARLRRSEVDLVGGVTATAERRKAFSFPAYATGDYRPYLYAHSDSPCEPNNLRTWQGIEIALGQGDQACAMLEAYLKRHGITYRLRRFENGTAAVRAFRSGEVGAIYALGTAELLSAKLLASFPSQPTYFCVPNARTNLLEQLESGILRLQGEQPDLGLRIRNRYFPVVARPDPEFTPAERAWLTARIESGEPVVVDLTPTVLPFKGWHETADRPVGLVYNILSEVGRRTGLTFQFLEPDDETSARMRFLHRKVDFWAPLGVPVDNLPGYAGGITVAALPQILLTRHGRPPLPLTKARFGVPSWDTRWQDDYHRAGATNLLPFVLLRDALTDLVADRIDAITVSLPQALTACQNLNIIDRIDFTRLDARLPYRQKLVVVPSARADAHLVSIVSKSVCALSDAELSQYTYHAVTESLSHAVLTDQQWLVVVIVLLALGLVSLGGTFAFFHIRLSRALVRARAGERARTQFLATMSHEIRTPLNAVIGFAEFLVRPGLSASDVRDYAQGIFRASHVLLELINDVLDLSKLEAGKIDMRQGATDFVALKREFIAIFAAKVRERGLRFVFDLPADVPRLRLTPLYLRQILLNLIGNSIKFTEKGSVTCTVRLTGREALGFVDLELAVADTGIGISSAQLATVFDPFEQDISVRGGHVYEGTGLGLPIVKRLAEAAGGSVSVTSTPHVGTTFVLRIPHVATVASTSFADAAAASEPITGTLPRSAVLVDDVPLNLLILKNHLANLGVRQIRTANSGEEALRLLAEKRADILLTDMWMPGMDGAALARRVRSEAAFAGIRIVAVTADAETEATFDMSAFDAVLTKPVTSEKLRAVCSPP